MFKSICITSNIAVITIHCDRQTQLGLIERALKKLRAPAKAIVTSATMLSLAVELFDGCLIEDILLKKLGPFNRNNQGEIEVSKGYVLVNICPQADLLEFFKSFEMRMFSNYGGMTSIVLPKKDAQRAMAAISQLFEAD